MEKNDKDHDADNSLKRFNFGRRTFLKGLLASGIGVLGGTLLGPILGVSSKGSAAQKDGDFLVEPARKVPIIREVDVLVVGGGMAGVGAAVAAGRMGFQTALVEYFGCLGGNGTSGMVNNFCGYTTNGEDPVQIVFTSGTTAAWPITLSPFQERPFRPILRSVFTQFWQISGSSGGSP